METPGGMNASAAWSALAKGPVTDPPRFLRALLENDQGRLLGFFFTLGQLDSAHQKFFTSSETRLRRFYELFQESPNRRDAGARVIDESFGPFLRQIPLNEDDVGQLSR